MHHTEFDPAARLLLGPGPSMVAPRVMRAMGAPTVGHLDPQFIAVMDQTQDLLRHVFQAGDDYYALPISGTGTAGMEAAVANFVEPGDSILICVHGYFGLRIAEMARRYGGDVETIEVEWGKAVDAADVDAALSARPAKIVAIVHGETSTGVEQPLKAVSDVVHQHGALLLVDSVASLGGVEVNVTTNDIDICYSGSQKCLSAPPGLAPLIIGPRAIAALDARETPCTSWYLDLKLLRDYWGPERKYHHTAPINTIYGLREALVEIEEEGLENRFARHKANAEMLWDGLAALDMVPLVEPGLRLNSLTTIQLPPGLDEADVRRRLLSEYNIEVAGGLGVLAGKVWRIGLMGYSSRPENITSLLGALERIIG